MLAMYPSFQVETSRVFDTTAITDSFSVLFCLDAINDPAILSVDVTYTVDSHSAVWVLVVGIVLGVLLVTGLVSVGVWLWIRKRRRQRLEMEESKEKRKLLQFAQPIKRSHRHI
jgi:hypothetical protein